MVERITFEFTGRLADDHVMNFYEVARFQYSAARLLVKLAQFRLHGRFKKKVTNKGNLGILLETQEDGSFRINVTDTDDPESSSSESEDKNERFVDASLGDLLSYVTERVVERTSDEDLANLFNSNAEIRNAFGYVDPTDNAKLQDITREVMSDVKLRELLLLVANDTLEKRISELGRQERLVGSAHFVAKIDPAREQKLISMAAPLITEMATALRKSAERLTVQTTGVRKSGNVLYLNREMAKDVMSTKMDKDITPILGNVIQYNKENGWGKLRLKISRNPVSFSVPSDLRSEIQSDLLKYMQDDEVYLQLYLVRDRSGEPVRAILVGILDLPKD